MIPDETKCANLGPGGIARRRNSGMAAAISAVVLAVLLFTGEWSPWWRLILFPILVAATLGFLQARGATCVYVARLGARETEAGLEPIDDAEEVAALRRKGRRIMVQSILIAGIITAVLLAIR